MELRLVADVDVGSRRAWHCAGTSRASAKTPAFRRPCDVDVNVNAPVAPKRGRPPTPGAVRGDQCKGRSGLSGSLIPNPIDQNSCAHWRNPMDMMRQG